MSNIFTKWIYKFLKSKPDKYYQQIYSEDDIKDTYSNKIIYHKIKSSLKSKGAKISHKPIRPLDKSNFENITIAELNNSFGKARAKYSVQLGDRKIKVYLYKNIYAGFKTSITAHFYRKKIFNLRYDFKTKDEADYIEIANLIGLKYLNGNPIDIDNDYLIDENNIILSFLNEFSLTLNYHNNSEVYSYINYLVDLDKKTNEDKVYSRYKKLYKKL